MASAEKDLRDAIEAYLDASSSPKTWQKVLKKVNQSIFKVLKPKVLGVYSYGSEEFLMIEVYKEGYGYTPKSGTVRDFGVTVSHMFQHSKISTLDWILDNSHHVYGGNKPDIPLELILIADYDVLLSSEITGRDSDSDPGTDLMSTLPTKHFLHALRNEIRGYGWNMNGSYMQYLNRSEEINLFCDFSQDGIGQGYFEYVSGEEVEGYNFSVNYSSGIEVEGDYLSEFINAVQSFLVELRDSIEVE